MSSYIFEGILTGSGDRLDGEEQGETGFAYRLDEEEQSQWHLLAEGFVSYLFSHRSRKRLPLFLFSPALLSTLLVAMDIFHLDCSYRFPVILPLITLDCLQYILTQQSDDLVTLLLKAIW